VHIPALIILILSSHLCQSVPSSPFPSDFPTKSCTHISCPAICAIFLDLFTQIIFGDDYYHKNAKHIPLGSTSRLTGTSCVGTYEYKSWSSLLCYFFQFRVTTSIIGSNYLRQHPILKHP
jgi:hypothetical protein